MTLAFLCNFFCRLYQNQKKLKPQQNLSGWTFVLNFDAEKMTDLKLEKRKKEQQICWHHNKSSGFLILSKILKFDYHPDYLDNLHYFLNCFLLVHLLLYHQIFLLQKPHNLRLVQQDNLLKGIDNKTVRRLGFLT